MGSGSSVGVGWNDGGSSGAILSAACLVLGARPLLNVDLEANNLAVWSRAGRPVPLGESETSLVKGGPISRSLYTARDAARLHQRQTIVRLRHGNVEAILSPDRDGEGEIAALRSQ